MFSARSFFREFFLLAVGLCFLTRAEAAPYASGVTNKAGTIQWILNESATDVQVLFDNGSVTNGLGSTPTVGTNSFSLAGHTNFSIVVSKNGSGVLSQISSDTNMNNGIFGPRGVAVNKNPKTWNFGRIYIANANAGAPSAGGVNLRTATTARGLFLLDAASDDIFARGASGTLAGMSLGTSTTYGPYKLFIGPDDNLFVGDASTGNIDGIWMVNPEATSSTNVFPRANPSTTATNYGQVVGTPCVTGSLSNGTLVVQALMWDTITTASGAGFNQVYKYVITNTTLPWTLSPVIVTNPIALALTNTLVEDAYTAPDGKIFICAVRPGASDGKTNVCVLSSTGTLLWDSKSASAAFFGDTNNDHLGPNDYGIAVSADDKFVAIMQSTNSFLIMALTNGVPDISTLTANTTVGVGGGGTAWSIDFDAADRMCCGSIPWV